MNFGILVFPGVEELDFIGPWELLRMWSVLAEGPKDCFLIAQSLEPIVCAKGLSINPSIAMEDCPRLDFLLVPGGEGTLKEVDNPVLIRFIEEQARGCQAVLSVCTGSFLLHRAGLLSGKTATTHWAWLDRLRALGGVEVVEERYVRDGKVWSAAGISAGIDLMLALIASVAGDEAAGKVQFRTEYYPSAKLYADSHTRPEAPAYLKARTRVAS